MKQFDLEPVYDQQIAPLMAQIIEICKREQLPMLASFCFASGREQQPDQREFCTTYIVRGDEPVPELSAGLRAVKDGARPFVAAIMVTPVQPGVPTN